MKPFILVCIFAIGMMFMWPPGEQVQAANSDQVSFVVGHQPEVPAVEMLQDNYTFDQIGNVKYQNVISCRKGGGVEVQVLNLVTQTTYLINNKMKAHNFTLYCNYNFRLCHPLMVYQSKNIQVEKIQSHDPVKIRADTSV